MPPNLTPNPTSNPTPSEAMEIAVNEIAHTLIKRGALRAQELITQALAQLDAPAPAPRRIVEKMEEARRAAGVSNGPSPAKRVCFLKRVDLLPLKEKLLAHIMLHPGQRSKQLMPAVRPPNVKPDAVQRALAQLTAERWVTTEGVARGTKYTAALKSPRGSKHPLSRVLATRIRKG